MDDVNRALAARDTPASRADLPPQALPQGSVASASDRRRRARRPRQLISPARIVAASASGCYLLLAPLAHQQPLRTVRLLLGTLFALGVAALVGLGSTWLALTQGQAFGGLSVGAWTAWPRHGTAAIDPYARAMVARSGQLPVGSGDGLAFQARSDDQGNALDGRCDVVLSGMTPQARYWTLTLYDPDGGLVRNSVRATASPATRSCGAPTARSRSRSRRARGPATGCRPAASSATCWCCGSTTRRSASPPAAAR